MPSKETSLINPFPLLILISAFLLFQVQPILARYILPWFGGSPGVWTTSLLFFQSSLLLGYAYAHGIARWLSLEQQCAIHSILVIFGLLLMPITPDRTTIIHFDVDPIWQLLYLLATSVGIPFILLSATAPLIQHWFTFAKPGCSPFPLYSRSNIGSLVALFSYPIVVEPLLKLKTQTFSWSAGYLVFVCALLWCARDTLKLVRLNTQNHNVLDNIKPPLNLPVEKETTSRIKWSTQLEWIVLSALGSIMLLAGTTQITQNIAAVPLLWVLPLSCYLITFIICFDHDKWYIREAWIPCYVITTALMISLQFDAYLDTGWEVAINLAALFSACMICHGELVRIRPKVRHLTQFYLMVALGGALGGVFVNLIAPNIFVDYSEYYLVIFAISLLAGVQAIRNRCWFSEGNIPQQYILLSLGLFIGFSALLFSLYQLTHSEDNYIAKFRNFYGTVQVEEIERYNQIEGRVLYHGMIEHGSQWFDERHRRNAYSYYGKGSGIEKIISNHPKRINHQPLKVAIIGLGVGAISVYAKPGDQFTFYEINEAIVSIARNYFSYLLDAEGGIDIKLGDGRVNLEAALQQGETYDYDILVLDAFSGDAIPTHLLTEEAAELFSAHLAKQDGVLVVLTSSDYLELEGVVLNMANHIGRSAIMLKQRPDDYKSVGNTWIIISNSDQVLENPEIINSATPWPDDILQIEWRDDFSNIFKVLSW